MLKLLFAIKDVQLPGKQPFYQELKHYIRNIIRISFVLLLFYCLFYMRVFSTLFKFLCLSLYHPYSPHAASSASIHSIH